MVFLSAHYPVGILEQLLDVEVGKLSNGLHCICEVFGRQDLRSLHLEQAQTKKVQVLVLFLHRKQTVPNRQNIHQLKLLGQVEHYPAQTVVLGLNFKTFQSIVQGGICFSQQLVQLHYPPLYALHTVVERLDEAVLRLRHEDGKTEKRIALYVC